MKKFTSIMCLVLTAAMLFAFVGCGDDEEPIPTGNNDVNVQVDPESGLEIVVFEGDYTWKDSVSILATNWNPHTYETADDSYPLDFITAGLYTFIYNDALHPVEGKDPFDGYKIVPEMAAELPVDVTEDIAKNKPAYGVPADATKGYAYKIKLNEKATWQDGTPIKAVDYVESMRRLFDPRYLNYRAVDYMGSNDLAIANADKYYNALTKVLYENINADEATALVAEGKDVYIDAYYFWNAGPGHLDAEGNPAPKYVSIKDETVYGENVDDAFSGKTLWDEYGAATIASYNSLYKAVTNEDYTENWAENFDKEVGIFASGEYEITIVLEKSLSGFYLLYSLSGNWLVKTDLYDKCLKQEGDTYLSTYNTSVETSPSYGPYKLVSYQADKGMRFEKNDKWYGHYDLTHVYTDPEDGLNYRMYQTTAIDCQVVAEAETRKLMFLKGELMGYGLQAADYDSYRGSKYCYASPATSTFFLILNGHKSAIATREAAEDFDKTKYDLECMTLTSFKQALALSYDRDQFASDVSPARKGAYGLFGTAYIYDPDTGATYRDTDQAKKALCEFYAVDTSKYASLDDAVASITGYDVEGARKFFKQAYDEAIAAGFITDANKDGKSDQTVRMEYAMSAPANDFMTTTIKYLNDKVAEVTKGTPFEGKIEFVMSAVYGNAWSDKLKQGLADTCLAGWQGSQLNPYSLTDLYVNPTRSYTNAWFDPSTVDMELTIDGNKIKMNLTQWSDALNGTEVEVGGKKYNFGDGQTSVENRLTILASFETAVLKSINYLPMLEDGSMALLSQQVYYVVESYNSVMGRGGMAYAKYNFNDTEWADFVKSSGGQLKY